MTQQRPRTAMLRFAAIVGKALIAGSNHVAKSIGSTGSRRTPFKADLSTGRLRSGSDQRAAGRRFDP